jgi:membrane protein implicated in regulation of membrane protease activity
MRIGSAEVNLPAFGIYVFILIPAFLAHSAFGGIFTALMFALLAFVIFSLIHLFVSYRYVTVLQEFNNDHPKKGEEIGFEFKVAMEGLIPTCRVGMGV